MVASRVLPGLRHPARSRGAQYSIPSPTAASFRALAHATIAFKVRIASCGGTACVNSFGDEQLAVAMLANKLLFDV
ncbi:hypothetical protein HU200_004706 [Digitaria exilis]|uniref:Uncharacterized protein n=1 Tax=Digitaria exilis TaxID=1010633 RepID=A0A835FRU4_9POAL|nr:hypothetical protein HU200_004706 [Digitaria exilis]